MDMERLHKLADLHREHLRAEHERNPGAYRWPISELDKRIEDFVAAVTKRGSIKGYIIDSPAFKADAKALGIKHTYKAFDAYLNGED